MDYQTDIIYSEEEFFKVFQDIYRANDPAQYIKMSNQGNWESSKLKTKFAIIPKPDMYPCVCISVWDVRENSFMEQKGLISSPKFVFLDKQSIDIWAMQLNRTKNESNEEKQKGFIV